MKWGLGFLRQRTGFRSICKKIASRNEGVALILTLLILLTLVLLGLALLLQTDTEYLIAVNEQDSLETFHHAEAGLSWTKREVLDIAAAAGFANFSDLLNGPDNADATDNNLIPLKTLDLTLTVGTDQLTAVNELATSIVVTKDFGDGSKTYEAFRLGINEDGDTDYDGPRALVYVRIDDNYDDATGNDPLVDTDNIITATVVSEYPIFTDTVGGVEGVAKSGTRTIARRKLRARFGTAALQPAILARRSLRVQGNPAVCGECGSVHANDTIYGGGNPDICKNFTWIDADEENDQFNCPPPVGTGTAEIGEECGSGFDEIEVPIINPYRNEMVPIPATFDGSAFGCDQSTPKYFALVSNNSQGLVFKAIWDGSAARPDPHSGNPTGGWKWKLIDDLNEGGNTRLDDCGRVVCGTVNGVDVHEAPYTDNTCATDGTEPWVDDDKDDQFYGFDMDSTPTSSTGCSGDVTLSSGSDLDDNDFNTTNFYCDSTNSFCTPPTHSGFQMLPGGFDEDGIRDFADSAMEKDKGRWTFGGKLVSSPVYNAVIFVTDHLNISGSPGDSNATICTSASSGLLNKKCEESGSALLSSLGSHWRASFIVKGSIEVSGNPKYSTATPAFSFLLAAGRDIKINGNADTNEKVCQPESGECAENLTNSAELAGIIAAHEQIGFSGNFSLDGFIIIEDAVDCANLVQRTSDPGDPVDLSGNPNVHYDCVNPPNPFASKVKLTSWEEVQ